QTILGRLWHDPGMQSFVESLEQGLLAKITQEIDDPDAAKAIDTVRGFVRLVLSRPVVVGVAQKETQDGPPVYGFAMLDAGPRKAEIASALAKLEALAGEGNIVDVQVGSLTMHGPENPGGVPGYWGWVGDRLVFSINDGTGLAMKYLQGSNRVAPDYLRKVPGTGDAFVIHINRQKIFNVLGAITGMQGAEDEFGAIQAVIKELGLDELKSVTARMGFDGPDMVSNVLLEIAQPRTGLLANLKTIDLAMFDAVDSDTMSASVFNCDVAGIYDIVMKAGRTVLGDEFTEVEGAIAEIETELKIKIRDGLLKSIDGQMVFYSIPGGAATGSPQGAFALVAKLKDPKLWEETLTSLGQFAAGQSEGMVQISSQDQGGRTMHTWTIAPLAMVHLMPSWCIVDDKVVIASNPTFLRSAVDQIGSGKQSIRSTAGFKKVTAKLPDNLISLKYSDSKVQFNQMMMGLQQFWPMVTMGATQAGFKLPALLPNLSHIAEHMGPSCQYSWFDAQGLRSHYRGTGIEPGIGVAAGAGVGLGIMMPALARARQQARRTVSAMNLKQLGLALNMYADEHQGTLPDSIEQAKDYYGNAKILESPFKPKDFEGPSYIYIAGQDLSMYPGNFLAYENPGFCFEGVNVLHLDGHVEWMRPDVLMHELEATYKRLGREMPEIEFKNP
ncbi:DUF1559 domain-containing protein, partial [Planctomycetota bacterium]